MVTGYVLLDDNALTLHIHNLLFQVSAPSLVAEVAHPRFRAPVTASLHCTYFFGSAIAGWVNFGVTSWDSPWAWRVPVILQCCGSVPVLLWAISTWMVESPRWLVFQNRETEAHQLLAKLHSNGLIDDELVLNELAEINETIQAEKRSGQASYLDFWKTPGNRKRLAVAFVFAFLSQMSGVGSSPLATTDLDRTDSQRRTSAKFWALWDSRILCRSMPLSSAWGYGCSSSRPL